MLKNYWELLVPFKRTFGVFLLLAIVYEGLQILDGYQLTLATSWIGKQTDPWWWGGLFVFWFVFDEAFMRLDNRFDWQIIANQTFPIYKDLKTRAIEILLSMNIPWHRKNNSGVLVGKVTNGVYKTLEVHDAASWEFVPTVIQILWSAIPLAIFSPATVIAAIVAFVGFMGLTYLSSKEKESLRKLRHDLYEKEYHKSIEMVQGVDTLVMFGQVDRVLDEQEKLHQEIVDTGRQEARIGIYKYNRWRIRLLSWSRRIVMILWIFQLMHNPDLTQGLVTLFFVSALYEKLSHSFWRFSRLFDKVADASEATKRVGEILKLDHPEKHVGEDPQITGPIDIVFEDVCFSYDDQCDDENAILRSFNLTIPAGKTYAFVGPSGAGKTTIKLLASGLYLPQKGAVKVAGIDTKMWNRRKLLDLFSPVPQGDDVFIFEGTIRENIARAKPEATLEEIIQAAKLAGIHDFFDSLPDKYETKVGERGKRLSGGEKQRLAIARAILPNRPILVLDEATSAVDAITEKEMQSRMKMILAGKSAIIIAHRLSTIWEIADQIVVIDGGKIVEQGTHSQLMANSGLYSQMVLLQTA